MLLMAISKDMDCPRVVIWTNVRVISVSWSISLPEGCPNFVILPLATSTILFIALKNRNSIDKCVQVILVYPEEPRYAVNYLHRFVRYDYESGDDKDADNHANNIIQLLGDSVEHLSGCFTYDENFLYLTAVLCEKLEFIGISPDAARIVKSKKETYEILTASENQNLDYNTAKHCPVSFRIEKEDDIWKVKELSFPAILKPEYSHCAMGVTEVNSLEDCVEQYHKLQNSDDIDWMKGRSLVLMEFLPGISYQVEVVIFNGDLINALPSVLGPRFRDACPKLPQVFSDTTTCFSSCLPKDLTSKLITASFQCCKKIGLYNGVFNVEMKLTHSGFKLVEINGRVGCYRRCSVFKVTECIDLWITQALISCGVRPIFTKLKNMYAVGCYLYSSIHRIPLTDPEILGQINDLCNEGKLLFIKETEAMEEEREYPRPYVHFVALDESSIVSAKEKLIDMCRVLKLSTEDYDIIRLTDYITDF